jgi:hypothetical protein
MASVKRRALTDFELTYLAIGDTNPGLSYCIPIGESTYANHEFQARIDFINRE